MIRKLNINELEKGMYISGFEKEGSDNALFFMNSLLVKSKKDLEEFTRYGYRSAYVLVDEPREDTPKGRITEKMHTTPGNDRADGRSREPYRCGEAITDGWHGFFLEGDLDEPPQEDAAALDEICSEWVEELTEVAPAMVEDGPAGPDPGHASEVKATGQGPTQEPSQEHSGEVDATAREQGRDEEAFEIKNTVEFSAELTAAKAIRAEAEALAREFMSDVYQRREIDTEKVEKTVDDMVESIFRNRDALTSLVRLKSADDYTFSHCVNVAVLALTIGRQMGLDKAELHALGVGAILHDVGKMVVSQNVLKKPGPLTSNEFNEMKRHTELGAELLSETSGISEDSIFVVLEHHEKFNGTGYPGQRSRDDIHLYARITAVADVYDAMTSNRVYQKKMPPDIALQKMYTWREASFEPTLVERLIKCLGIYPIGTLVELNTGEVAVVKSTNHSDPLKPTLLILFDEARKQVVTPYEVDLGTEVARWVVNSRDPNKLGVDIDPIIA